MNSMAETITLNNALSKVPSLDGRNPSLKDFIQDTKNAKAYIAAGQENSFVSGILSKLHGAARDSFNGKEFRTLDEIITHIKKRFAPGKNYSYYVNKLNQAHMKQGDTVGGTITIPSIC